MRWGGGGNANTHTHTHTHTHIHTHTHTLLACAAVLDEHAALNLNIAGCEYEGGGGEGGKAAYELLSSRIILH